MWSKVDLNRRPRLRLFIEELSANLAGYSEMIKAAELQRELSPRIRPPSIPLWSLPDRHGRGRSERVRAERPVERSELHPSRPRVHADYRSSDPAGQAENSESKAMIRGPRKIAPG
jgi:hypothetical protein